MSNITLFLRISNLTSRDKHICEYLQCLYKGEFPATFVTAAVKEGHQGGVIVRLFSPHCHLLEKQNAEMKQIMNMGTTVSEKKKKRRRKKKKKKVDVQTDEVPSSSHKGSSIADAEEKLKSARFRFINEQLYTSSGEEAMKIFREDPLAFEIYHQGYRSQVVPFFTPYSFWNASVWSEIVMRFERAFCYC